MHSIKLSAAIPASELKYNNTLIGGTCRAAPCAVGVSRAEEDEEVEVEVEEVEDKTRGRTAVRSIRSRRPRGNKYRLVKRSLSAKF